MKHLNYPELVHRLRILRLQVQKEDQPRCYVAGPMRSLPLFNFLAFEKAGEALRDAGWYVYSPRDNDEAAGLTAPSTGDPEAALPLKHYMAKDLAQVCKSDAVIVLPGWEESEGARLEVDVAQRVDVPVYTYLHQRAIERGPVGVMTMHDFQEAGAAFRAMKDTFSVRDIVRNKETGEEFEVMVYDPARNGKTQEWREDESIPAVRKFDSGATRNPDENQLDYEGFLSPIALKRFAEYMHKHRRQADGSLRASDNWQKGIPLDSYVKSLVRHTMDVWLEHRGGESREGIEDGLCGVLFNGMGMLLETLKKKEAA